MGAKGISRVAPVGKRFGRVTVISTFRTEGRSSVVDGRCDCGDVRAYFVANLRAQGEPMCPACRTKSPVLCSKRTKAITDVLPCGDERIAYGDVACAAPTSGVSYRGIC